MLLEYEYRYKDFDKKLIIKKLKELGAIKHGYYIFKVQVFIHLFDKPDTYIRVRDESHRVTMTYKTDLKKQFVT